ncbi:MAG: PH domain-containing protein, partial [Lysinibacillus sp.]
MTFKYPKIKVLYEFLDQFISSIFFLLIIYVLNYNTDSTFMIILKFVYAGILFIAMFGRLNETIFTKVDFAVDGVRVYTGIFSKSERFIPRKKFENVQTSASVLQRIFGAQKVVMETGDAAGDVT